MNKLLALVLILGLNSGFSAEKDVVFSSLRLNLWYQGLEGSLEADQGIFDLGKRVDQSKLNPELIELALKFGNQAKPTAK